jgi:hypothetical protein
VALVVVAAAVTATLVALSAADPGTRAVSFVRDWLPAPLMLVTYRSSGLLLRAPRLAFQRSLAAMDRVLLRGEGETSAFGRVLDPALELTYLLCYALVPLGVATLYVAGFRGRADDYWRIVLPPSYVCYGLVPLLHTLPPRFDPEEAVPRPGHPLRRLNWWILDRAAIPANTFPSAHVAASAAAALASSHFVPASAAFFVPVAAGIAAGAVHGRYHYAADAVSGVALALASYVIWRAG